MRLLSKTTLLLLIALLAAGTVSARKLPVGTYIKSAKIKILQNTEKGYVEANYMLDSLFLWYGPHAEGLYLKSQIIVDDISKTASPVAKMPMVKALVGYIDTLHACCENEEVNKKYRKNCDKYVSLMDSIKVKYWREYYNAGIAFLTDINDLSKELEVETDSSSLDFINRTLNAATDSCIDNMSLAIVLDDSDYRSYVAIGTVYEYKGEYAEAITWLSQGLEKGDDRGPLLLPIAYDYIQIEDYCSAIPYFTEHVDSNPDDISTMHNLAICHNNCDQFDQGRAVFAKILAADSTDVRAYSAIGRFFNQRAREVTDSARASGDAGDDAAKEAWDKTRDNMFDSSYVYFKKAFELSPDDEFVAGEYGRVSYLRSDFESAAIAFTRLTELAPDDVDNWTTLGDCYLQLKQFPEAATAYEKVIEADPENIEMLERLEFLYRENGQTDKMNAVAKKLKSL